MTTRSIDAKITPEAHQLTAAELIFIKGEKFCFHIVQS